MVKGGVEFEHSPEEGLVLRIKPPFGSLVSGETRKHARAARKEMLMVLRSLIDGAISRIDEKEKQSEKTSTRIEVQ
jgi:hypothetical protein